MADGSVIYRTTYTGNVLLLDAAGGLDDGVWVDAGDYMSGMVSLQLGGSTIEVCGSNNFALPPNNTHGVPLAVAGNTNGWLAVAVLPRWIKARLTIFVAQASVGVQLRR